MNKKANQHYQLTHKKIRDTFLVLLRDHDLQDITITEICGKMNISRGTFYVHYTDVYDLLEKTEMAMAGEMEQRFLAARERSNRDAFLEIFRYAKENRTFYSIYLERGKSMQVEENLSFDDFQNPDVSLDDPRHELSDIELYYHNALFKAVLRALLRSWFDRDCRESPEELLDILQQQYQYSNLKL